MILVINVQSLRAKTGKLSASTCHLREYRSASVLAIIVTLHSVRTSWTQTSWCSEQTETATSPGRKACQDGVCLLIRDEWYLAVVVRENLCTPDINLCLSLAFPVQRVSSNFLTVEYIFTQRKIFTRQQKLFLTSHKFTKSLSPDAPKFILGDFNNSPVKKFLHTYYNHTTSEFPFEDNKIHSVLFYSILPVCTRKIKTLLHVLWNSSRCLLCVPASTTRCV